MKLLLFTDGSVNTKLRIGFGAYLACLEDYDSQESLADHIRVKRFVNTSSTKLELQTLLWALSEVTAPEIDLYTDSQNIVGLNARRKKLEGNEYLTKKGKLLNNYELYKQFYKFTDYVDIQIMQVHGHLPSGRKNRIDRIFTLVDRASRKALRTNSVGNES